MKLNIINPLLITLMMSTLKPAPTSAQQAAFYPFKVGTVTVVALSDGTVPLDAGKLFQTEKDKAMQLLEAAYLHNPVETSINTYLIIQ